METTLETTKESAHVHIQNLIEVVDTLVRGYEDPRLAPMPQITRVVVDNARAWMKANREPASL